MRKSLLWTLMIGLFTFAIACETPTSSAGNQDGEAASTGEASDAEPMQNGEYEISIVDKEPKSPRKEMKANINGANIVINYGSPAVKGREIWGGLEKWGQVWRAGANEATRFTTDKELSIGEQTLPAGTYGLFVIPNENGAWTIIFNQTADQWGAYEYDESKDVLRVNATPRNYEDSQEMLDYMVEDGKIVLRWEKIGLAIV